MNKLRGPADQAQWPFIRTGLAFLALGRSLFRYFGFSWWSVFDGFLVLASLVMIAIGGRGYVLAARRLRRHKQEVGVDGISPEQA